MKLPWKDIEADYLAGMMPRDIVRKYKRYGLNPKTLDSRISRKGLKPLRDDMQEKCREKMVEEFSEKMAIEQIRIRQMWAETSLEIHDILFTKLKKARKVRDISQLVKSIEICRTSMWQIFGIPESEVGGTFNNRGCCQVNFRTLPDAEDWDRE